MPSNFSTILAVAAASSMVPSYRQSVTQVDFAHYKNVLKNQQVVSDLEQTWKSFKPADYDVNAQLKAIEAFQGKAVSGGGLLL